MSHEQVWQTREILGAALAQEQPNQPRSVLSCMILREGGITLQDLTGVCEKNAHVFKRPTNCSSNPRSPNFSVAVKRMRITKTGRFHFSPLHSWHPVANVEIGVRGEWIQRCLFAMCVCSQTPGKCYNFGP